MSKGVKIIPKEKRCKFFWCNSKFLSKVVFSCVKVAVANLEKDLSRITDISMKDKLCNRFNSRDWVSDADKSRVWSKDAVIQVPFSIVNSFSL